MPVNIMCCTALTTMTSYSSCCVSCRHGSASQACASSQGIFADENLPKTPENYVGALPPHTAVLQWLPSLRA